MRATTALLESVDAAPRVPLPAELGAALLTLATSAVPIRLVSRLSEDLTLALAAPLPDADVVTVAALLSRAAGPWLPTTARYAALARQLEAALVRNGCDPLRVQAVLGDLDEAFLARRAQARPARWS